MQILQRRAGLVLLLSLALGPLPGRAESPPQGGAPPPAFPAPATAPPEPGISPERLAILAGPGNEGAHRVSRHYLWSNERRHDIFFDDVRGLGGGYIGVGADQNYSLAAAAGADMVWLIDLDQAVVHLHQLYAALIAVSPTPEEFLAFLSGKKEQQVTAIVSARYPGQRQQQAILQIYQDYQPLLYKRLRRTYQYYPNGAQANWLNHPELYRYVRRLVQEGRMVARVGDLTGPRTMQQIGEAARAANLPVRVVYLSNAESWFHYSARFARNLQGLALDERSVVLRTVKSDVLRYAPGDVWHFSVQQADDFRQKLLRPNYGSIDAIMGDLLAQDAASQGAPPGVAEPATSDRPAPRRGLSHIEPGGPREGHREAREGLVTRPAASPSIPLGDG